MKTTFSMFQRWQNRLEEKYSWYRGWHKKKWTSGFSVGAAVIFALLSSVCVVYSLMSHASGGTGSIVLLSPYHDGGSWYKANLHSHSYAGPLDGAHHCMNDDGTDSPATVAKWYSDHDYAFYALSGHVDPHYYRCHHDSSNQSDALITKSQQVFETYKKFIDINKAQGTVLKNPPSIGSLVAASSSMELNMFPFGATINKNANLASADADTGNMNGAHIGFVNIDDSLLDSVDGHAVPDYNVFMGDSVSGVLKALKKVSETGGVSIVNHAASTMHGYASSTAVAIAGMDYLTGMEIRKDYQFTNLWDDQLRAGHYVWGFGSDDGHNGNYGEVGGRGTSFIVINSSKSNPGGDEFIKQIKAGNFYVSTHTNAAQKDYYDLKVTTTGSTIHAETTNGDYVRFIIDGTLDSANDVKYKSGNHTFPPGTTSKYVRVEVCTYKCTSITNKAVAYSQPVLIKDTARDVTVLTTSYISPAVGQNFPLTAGATTGQVSGLTVRVTNPWSSPSWTPGASARVVFRRAASSSTPAGPWYHLGCSEESSSTSGPNGQAIYPFHPGDCATTTAYQVSHHGWNDRNKDGARDDELTGFSYSFPGEGSNISLPAGAYEWSAQAVDELGDGSGWLPLRTFNVGANTIVTPSAVSQVFIVAPGAGQTFPLTTGLTTGKVSGFQVKATDSNNARITMRVVFRKAAITTTSAGQWSHFGCKADGTDLSPTNSTIQPFSTDCTAVKAYGISPHGFNDGLRIGARNYVTSGSSYTFPGFSATIDLPAGTYEWTAQTINENGKKSAWAIPRIFTVY